MLIERIRQLICKDNPHSLWGNFETINLIEDVNDYEISLLKEGLKRGKTQTEAARLLGLNRTTFLAKLKAKGIS